MLITSDMASSVLMGAQISGTTKPSRSIIRTKHTHTHTHDVPSVATNGAEPHFHFWKSNTRARSRSAGAHTNSAIINMLSQPDQSYSDAPWNGCCAIPDDDHIRINHHHTNNVMRAFAIVSQFPTLADDGWFVVCVVLAVMSDYKGGCCVCFPAKRMR